MSISPAEITLIQNLVSSDVFEALVKDIKKDLFEDWTQAEESAARDKIFFETQALDRLVDTIKTKALELSGDTKQ